MCTAGQHSALERGEYCVKRRMFCFKGISGYIRKLVLLFNGYFVHYHAMPLITDTHYPLSSNVSRENQSITDHRIKKAFQRELLTWRPAHTLYSRINRYVTSQTIYISQLEARLLATVSVLYCSYMVLYK